MMWTPKSVIHQALADQVRVGRRRTRARCDDQDDARHEQRHGQRREQQREAVRQEARRIEPAREARAARLGDLVGDERERQDAARRRAARSRVADGRSSRSAIVYSQRPVATAMTSSGRRDQAQPGARGAHAPGARALDAHAPPLGDLRVRELRRRLVGHHRRKPPQEAHGDDGRDDVGDVQDDECRHGLTPCVDERGEAQVAQRPAHDRGRRRRSARAG